MAYDAFFQVNSYINSKLFEIIRNNVKGKNVLDLYSGVGTLSIVSNKSANKVYGIEIIPNAVINALKNAKINNCHNIDFILGKVELVTLLIVIPSETKTVPVTLLAAKFVKATFLTVFPL